MKRLYASTILVLGVLALGASISMYLIAVRAERATTTILGESQSIEALARVESNLYRYGRNSLLFDETGEEIFRLAKERSRAALFEDLALLEALDSSAAEKAEITQLRALIDRFLAEKMALGAARLRPSEQMIAATPYFNRAVSALRRSIEASIGNAKETQLRLDDLVDLANGISLLAIVLFTTALIALTVAARRGVFRSFRTLRAALASYSAGNTAVRAPEDGPLELQEVARSFNELASSLETQRRNRFEFLLAVAHDLRTPLSALKVTVALAEVRARTGDLSLEQLSQHQRRISRQVDRLNRMVEDLVDITRIEAGRLDLAFAVSDLRNLVQETQEIFEEASSLHTVSVHLPSEPVMVRCDETRLGQVLNNLVSNAIKYSPGGGAIEVRLQRCETHAVVEVVDQGVGIAPSDYARIFEPFRRLRHEEVPGVGLGLSVAKRLVEAHQGRIEVESAPGVGSTFRVYLETARAEDLPGLQAEPLAAATSVGS